MVASTQDRSSFTRTQHWSSCFLIDLFVHFLYNEYTMNNTAEKKIAEKNINMNTLKLSP